MTKDAVAGRIRRLLAMADKRAKDLGIPDTESVVTADMLGAAEFRQLRIWALWAKLPAVAGKQLPA